MSNEDEQRPLKIVKKKKRHSGHSGGAWKVAYADFVTAMMALFIVLWIVAQNNAIKEAIAAYFKDPTVFVGGSGIHSGTLQLFPKPKPESLQTTDLQAEIERLKIEGKRIEDKIASTPLFDKFKDKIKITVSEEGIKIELIEDSEGLFFDVGSAKVKPETVELLKLIAREVSKLPNEVVIEGHTDARPYVTKGYSNWELSVDRANAARKHLEENGTRKAQIREVRGFADRFLRQPERPFDYSNRRVNILILPTKTTKVDSIAIQDNRIKAEPINNKQ